MDGLPPLPPGTQRDTLRQRAISNAAQQSGLPTSSNTPTDPPSPTSVHLEPIPWTSYFDNHHTIHLPSRDATFSIYSTGSGPSHGNNNAPVVLCLHGGGYTGLTWALIAQRLKATCRVVAPDLRGHGLTFTGDDGDVSVGTMAADVVAIWQHLFEDADSSSEGANPDGNSSGLDGKTLNKGVYPPTVLVGHSMGGALAVHAAALKGVVVIDVVEGTALASLPHMLTVLRRRPPHFKSLHDAIHWTLASGTSRNAEAAAVSLPSQLIHSSEVIKKASSSTASTTANCIANTALDAIAEDGNEDEEDTTQAPSVDVDINIKIQTAACIHTQSSPNTLTDKTDEKSGIESKAIPKDVWLWRTALEATVCHWEGWFTGLSTSFLALPAPKVLILAGTDRLDKELMVGQMQGKFQLVVLPQAGHAVHEDLPDKTADVITGFIKRFKIAGHSL